MRYEAATRWATFILGLTAGTLLQGDWIAYAVLLGGSLAIISISLATDPDTGAFRKAQ